MRSNLTAIVLALVFAGGLYFYYQNKPAGTGEPQTETSQTPADTSAPSTATNYDECIAEGNQPLPDAPDKCLTTDGHLFIQGVEEE